MAKTRLDSALFSATVESTYGTPRFDSDPLDPTRRLRSRRFSRRDSCSSPAKSSRSNTYADFAAQWPLAEFWNLYGPTETNVCTAFRIPETIDDDRQTPFPIGAVCPPFQARVVDDSGRDLSPGTIGELAIAGLGVTRGYFGRDDLTARAFLKDDQEVAWYRTGDLVIDSGDGCFEYRGRRDRMIKKRGYRIELGEIESALHRHDGVDRAAVVAKTDAEGVSILAFVALKDGRKRSIIAMKKHCAITLPHYMIPDTISFVSALPKTLTDKVDYQNLQRLAQEEHEPSQSTSAVS